MSKTKNNNLFYFIITFLLVLFKYIECWSYLFTKEFFKSKFIIFTVILFLILIIGNYKFEKIKFRRILIIGILCLFLTYLSKSIDFIISFSLVVLYSSISDGEKIFLKNFLKSSGILFVLTIVLSSIGILPSFAITRIVDGQIITRYNLGFLGANSLFLFFYPIIVSFLVLNFDKGKKTRFLYSIIVITISFLFYKYTNCRTGMLCVILLTCTFLFKSCYNSKLFQLFLKYHYFILLILALFLTIKFNAYNNSLNVLLSGRFYYWNYYVSNTKYTLFGLSPINGIPLDNLYLYNYYFYGIISYVICLIISIVPFKSNKINSIFYFITFAFCIYGFFENNISYVFSFLFFYQIYYIINYMKESSKNEK